MSSECKFFKKPFFSSTFWFYKKFIRHFILEKKCLKDRVHIYMACGHFSSSLHWAEVPLDDTAQIILETMVSFNYGVFVQILGLCIQLVLP